jgi:hypothetical protein
MTDQIKRDQGRFRDIIRGRVKHDLKKYITHGEMIKDTGRGKVSVPMPSIDIPRFKFGDNQGGGVAQGEGDVGDPIDGQQGEEGEGPGQGQKAGSDPGEHALEVELSIEELAEMLGEELELPKIEPRGDKAMRSQKTQYTSISSQGPQSLRHFKRTFREALKRSIATGQYDPLNPTVIPIKRDYRYRAPKTKVKDENNAVIIYMMDVSGSMGDEQKEIVRTESFWIDAWLKSQYSALETRFIIHDAAAREVDRDTFFRTRESGGTLISSAYKLCKSIIDEDYPIQDWNIYPFHFSDGDNWSGEDTRYCMQLLSESIMPASNVFCYGQVESRYGSGQFLKDLETTFGKDCEDLILSKIDNREAIPNSIKDFLGKGR